MKFFGRSPYVLVGLLVSTGYAGISDGLLVATEQKDRSVEQTVKTRETQIHDSKTVLSQGAVSTISGLSCANNSLVAQTADKLALPIEIVLCQCQPLRCNFLRDRLSTPSREGAQQARLLQLFLGSCRRASYDQFSMKDPSDFRMCNEGDVASLYENFAADFARLGPKGDWLHAPLKNYVKALCAINRATYMGMYARSCNDGYGPSTERRMMLKDQIQRLHDQLFAAAFVSPQELSSVLRSEMPQAVENCLESVALTPQALALHDQEDESVCSVHNEDVRSISSIAGYDEDDAPDSVRLSDRFACVWADSLIAYEGVGTCLRFPADIQALLPAVPMFHFVANQQGGPTCAYHAAANAHALKVLVQEGKFPSAARVRHEAQLYACDMQSIYDCHADHSLSIRMFKGVVKDPYDFQYYRKKNGERVFLSADKKKHISKQEADLSLQKLLDKVFICKQGVITCGCTVKEQGKEDCHAVLCALVKPRNKRLMFVYMDSNNGSLDRPESYAPDARAQVAMLIKAMKRRLVNPSSI